MIESWKDIQGTCIDKRIIKGPYMVSNLGKIKKKDGIILKPQKHHRGHLRVTIDGRLFRVHRIVATAFIPNPDGLPVVHHKDNNPENNSVENLEWCTQRENTLLQKKRRKIDGMIVAIRKSDSKHEYFQNIKEAERFLWDNNITKAKIPRIPIRDACDQKLGSAYGYRWYQVEKE